MQAPKACAPVVLRNGHIVAHVNDIGALQDTISALKGEHARHLELNQDLKDIAEEELGPSKGISEVCKKLKLGGYKELSKNVESEAVPQ